MVLESDPVLAAEYRAVYTERVEQFAVLAESLIAAGLLRPPEPPTTVRALVRVLWLVAETADPFAQHSRSANEPERSDMDDDRRLSRRTVLTAIGIGAARWCSPAPAASQHALR